MDKIIKSAMEIPSGLKRDDSFADRLSSRYSILLLVVFAIVVTASMWVGDAILCWAPVHFTGSHTKFANSYCWVKNTYYLPFEEDIPKAHEDEERHMIPYYQWIPFILLAQAALFYAPSVVWHGLNQKGGIDADSILQAANKMTKTVKVDDRDKMLKLITNQMDRFLKMRVETQGGLLRRICTPCGRRFGSYLVLLFLFSKVLYIANVIFQLFILNSVLATDYNIYGFEVMKGLWRDHDWTDSPGVAFPRVTMCDFNIRRLGNVHRYTVQCALPINLYNEKIYVFLWFWMVFVAVVSSLDFLVWFIRYCMRGDRVKFVLNHLTIMNKHKGDLQVHDVYEFVDNYLKQDGVFLLRLIIHNTNSATCTDILCSLYTKWIDRAHPSRSLINPTGDAEEFELDEATNKKIPMKRLT